MVVNDDGNLTVRLSWPSLIAAWLGGTVIGGGAAISTQPAIPECNNLEIELVRFEIEAAKGLWDERIRQVYERLERLEQ